jgi:hypothetical protein
VGEPERAVAEVRALVESQPDVDGAAAGVAGWLSRLCAALVRHLPAAGAGISVMSEAGLRGVVAASDPRSQDLEELQFTVGEGPCPDAFAARMPVLTGDLDGTGAARWPGYADLARARGIAAVFAFPLQIGAARLGVMDVYRARSGTLSAAEVVLALTFAELAVEALLDGQQRAGDGQAAAGLDQALDYRHAVYQAQGVLMVQLGISLTEALVRLRAYAYAHERTLVDVAADVVARRLLLTDGADGADG